MRKLLIANRGEIAIRIAHTAADLGIASVGVFANDDADSLHVKVVDEARSLGSDGVAAYLNIEQILKVAAETNCEAVHPGYGFLSESAEFARSCERAGLIFVGPTPETLDLFGDKAAARRAAKACGVPLLPGLDHAITLDEADRFLRGLGKGRAAMLKAIAGGGGRGMRPVERVEDLPEAFQRCASEALSAFGSPDLYIEELFPRARHIEVQILGDGQGGVQHLWDRECSLQRRRQKLIEIAPAFGLDDNLRGEILDAAVRLAKHANYRGLCTMEFLIDASSTDAKGFVFMEANPRIQVEHTVTEEISGLDLVAAQLQVAAGASLIDLGLSANSLSPKGVAVQLRVNMERMASDGSSRPTGGVIEVYEPPSGAGVRIDGFGYAGYATSPRYDSLLAKVIVHGPTLEASVARARRALSEFRIEGVEVNISFLQALLKSNALDKRKIHTRYIDDHIAELLASPPDPQRYFSDADNDLNVAGALVDPDDPLAVLSLRREPRAQQNGPAAKISGPPGAVVVGAPMQGTVSTVQVEVGQSVRAGQPMLIIEALKMEHAIPSPASGVVVGIPARSGVAILEGTPLVFIEPASVGDSEATEEVAEDLDFIRHDLALVKHVHALTGDEARAAARAKRHAKGKRTARENIDDLCDEETFLEYGPLVVPSRQHGETQEDLEAKLSKAPADGLVMGIGRVNGDLFGADRSRCAILSYDYSVVAGTQGNKGHDKTDRMLEMARDTMLPVVFFTEGGGGRPGVYPGEPPPPPTTTGGLKFATFRYMARLSGLVPVVGIVSGNCFAGNAIVLALCDVIIATRDTKMGIGGPALIEGGGLGRFTPEEVGAVRIQEPNGVIDILVEDEAEAVKVAKRYLSYFQGRLKDWREPDQRSLRHAIPENRRAPYDVRKIIDTLADEDSMLELRPRFGLAMVTALIRVEGRPLGVIANNCMSPTGGAVDSDAADKAARFMQLCDAFDIPLLTLLDVPGNMVGPEAEKTATLRHCGRLYMAGSNLSVPVFSVVLRKAYGLGALAMTGGGLQFPQFVVSWPTGEFADMGLEGRVKLGRRAELAAIEDVAARKARYEELLGQAYDWARAINGASVFEFDDLIDPADTRRWIAAGLECTPDVPLRTGKKRAFIDTW
ncbi:acetyl/propionyl-CoA carboxylase alpha subunit/acetyl-CoA carboxylase carboxyltransferase component [Bradyrhizobium sp. cir1]|uniref:carboxyl transferase domain-containing protein n=1 Tax=Bradyrhizobium sp. cir1 TaxID=1445730 RepID=UPI0016057661|nr:carboxyl transferase domain-containing protein [Bradyrhizobium sp. cir1]MBB4375145.1 acetyl/propionyl-CoA carboxylase alpha subunit/acetyl-CoA carboxylase carboxyltransferase component [Bradyrhizobium sp. cir1]